MKKCILISISFLLANFVFAQYKLNGYILTKKRDTVKGIIDVPKKNKTLDMKGLHRKVTFLDSANVETEYTSKDIYGFGIRSEDMNEDFITGRALGEEPTDFFFRRLGSGYIELLEAYVKVRQAATNPFGAPTYITTSEHSYFIKIGGRDTQILLGKDDLIKRKNLVDQLKNHPELAGKIEKDIDIESLKILVAEYNKKYLK